MESHNSTILNCPYCWSELPKQIEHIEAFPHPFLRSKDPLYRRFHNIIKPEYSIEKETSCSNCGMTFSITFFKQIPEDLESKQVYDICCGNTDTSSISPLFERVLYFFFNFVKYLVNSLSGYHVYDSSQKVWNFIAAFILLFIPLAVSIIIKIPMNPNGDISNFDLFLILATVLAAVLLIELYGLIESNNSKLNLSTLQFGLHENYIICKWGKAFEECYLRAPTNEYLKIPIINNLISRPMFVGLISLGPYLIYKYAIVEGFRLSNPNYPLFTSLSIIPFYVVLFFILGYSLSYAIIGSPVARIIARDIDMKINLLNKKDSYQELGDLLEKSAMVFLIVTLIFSTIIFGMYDSKILTFNFIYNYERLITFSLIFMIFFVMSWLWISSLIDLKDKYEIAKNEYLVSLKNELQLFESKIEKTSEDLISINRILFQIDCLLSKPKWPIDRPYLLSLLPLISPTLTVVTILRGL